MADPTKPNPRRAQRGQDQKGEVKWKWWALGVAVVLLLVIVLQNSQKVDFNLLFISTSTPLIVLLLITALIGAIIGYTGPILRRHRHNTRREYEKD
ncbi:MAG: LapA family protein [Thermoleophilia bacterium]|nr:LapA family protein [Thermoleophilia bacterium]